MLINTVILFLSDALPIIIIISILMAKATKRSRPLLWVYQGVVIGLCCTILLTFNLDSIAQLFNDRGLEFLFLFSYLAIYLLIIFILINENLNLSTNQWGYIAALIVTLSLSFNGANFLVYLTGYWSQADAVQSLVVGSVLGSGICLSIGILLYFFILYSEKKIFRHASSFLALFYGAGQLLKGSNLLFQIDLLSNSDALWDLNFIIKENSELGQFLNALVGYDASPSKVQIIIYVVSITLPLIFVSKGFQKLKENGVKNSKVQENM